MPKTFLWHDYETFGRDSARERPVQFASIRTDENLEEIDDGTMIYCRQSPDYLPDPGSCMVHGVLPQTANEKGMSEWRFADTVHRLMATANTCTVGFNSIRFDDEFTRQLLFRNLFDPYSREWRDGNSRWDLIDVVRLCRALRPDGIEWPFDADGKASNKLELLTAANGIEHGDAHDALADVRATIAIARLLKEKQPRLFDYAYNTRNKHWILGTALNLVKREPVLHVSGMYPASVGHLSMVMPLGPHPTNQNGVLVYDLRHDPEDLIELSVDKLKERIFTASKDLPEGTSRIAIKTVHANRCPVLVPVNTLDEKTARHWQLDRNTCLEHRQKLLSAESVLQKLAEIFTRYDQPKKDDPDLTLYSGNFASGRDKVTMDAMQSELSSGKPADYTRYKFDDDRLNELCFRLTARNWPETLSSDDQARWKEFCHQRVHNGQDGFRSLAQYRVLLEEMRASNAKPESVSKLAKYGEKIAAYSEQTIS